MLSSSRHPSPPNFHITGEEPSGDMMGDGVLSQLTYWHVRWVVPAALVKAALELGEGNAIQGLHMIAEKGELWMRSLARELLANPQELDRIIQDLEDGLRPDPELVDMIIKKIVEEY